MLRGLLTRTRRVMCRDEYGHRTSITPLPRPDGRGVRLKTGLGELFLSPLEVGRLRAGLAEAVLESEITLPGRAA